MARILHLSDLHFGRERFALVPRLIETVTQLAPDAVVVSGDLTQHATEAQFSQARAFLDALPAPVLSVPGNRDLSPWNMYRRLLRPFERWTRLIHETTEPMLDIKGARIVGINSVDPLALHRGYISEAALDRACAQLSAAPKEALRIIVMHHPFYRPDESGKSTMRAALVAAQALAEAGGDLILCGHLHHRMSSTFALLEGRRSLLNIESGSSLAMSNTGSSNNFNLIECSPSHTQVTNYECTAQSMTFRPVRQSNFRAAGPRQGWLGSSVKLNDF